MCHRRTQLLPEALQPPNVREERETENPTPREPKRNSKKKKEEEIVNHIFSTSHTLTRAHIASPPFRLRQIVWNVFARSFFFHLLSGVSLLLNAATKPDFAVIRFLTSNFLAFKSSAETCSTTAHIFLRPCRFFPSFFSHISHHDAYG